VLCNDLLPAFRGHARMKIYIENDDHWRLPGHVVAAEAIRAFVDANHLL
jgi:hypothetical protein